MSGHSKWANIKHRKGAADIKKGKIYSRLGKEIMVSVRQGGKDPSANTRLRTALLAARNANMPKDNIERAIKKGAGEGGESVVFESVNYEGYALGGVAVLVECLTDNRNRTAGEIRMLFDRANGNLAGAGAVTWMFHRKSHFVIRGENAKEDKLFDVVLDAGVEDIEVDGDVAEIWAAPENFEAITKALENAKIATEESGIVQRPENVVEVKEPHVASQVLGLVEKLESHDDVQAVYANFDIPEAVLEKIASEDK